MRKDLFVAVVMITVASFFVLSCGGGGGGGGGLLPPAAGVAAGTFVKTPVGNSDSWAGLLTMAYARWQNLYTAASISASGRITGVALKYHAALASAVTCTGARIKLSHSNLANLAATFANNLATGQGGQTTVLENATLTFPAAAADTWQNILFTTPFDYNGMDNLIVEFELPNACSGQFHDADMSQTYAATAWTFTKGTLTGSAGSWVQCTRLIFAGGEDPVELGGSSSSGTAPFGAAHMRLQNLYMASEINGSGPITGLGFKTYATTTTDSYTYTLKLGHTTLSQLTATFTDNYTGSSVTVVTNGTFTIPSGIPANTYVWIPFPGTFSYDGTSNLIMDLDVSTGNRMNSMLYTSGAGAARLAAGPTGTTRATGINANVLHAAFRFNGGTMDVIGSNDGQTGVFNTAATGRQFLLLASELGTSGSINKMACRLSSASTATSYPNFVVTLASTTQTALTADDAANVAGGSVVYSGTFNVPGGLLQGDWVEIPFSTPFSYDGADNLVVQTMTGAGGVIQYCQVTGPDATRYGDRGKGTGVSPVDYRAVLRFWVDK